DDVRVLELGERMAAPVAGMILADLGAEVIKIERPEGDPVRGCAAYGAWNRGKTILRLDLHERANVERFLALASQADAVISAVSRRALDRFGLNFASLSERAGNRNPVVCQIDGIPPGWRAGPEASDSIISALTGLFVPVMAAQSGGPARPIFYPLPLP